MKTTIEISTPLLRRAKKIVARDKTTLRQLIEHGLSHALQEREKAAKRVCPPLFTVKGKGLSPEYAGASWEALRDAIYEGRGT